MIRRIVLPCGFGQTCNQLFQIAHWLPTAIELAVPLYFPGFRSYRLSFVGTRAQRLPCFPNTAPALGLSETVLLHLCASMARVPYINARPAICVAAVLPGGIRVNWDSENRAPYTVVQNASAANARSLWANGWLYRDKPGIRRHEGLIKAFFSPISEIQCRVDECITSSRRKGTLLVGVHLRRGDYRRFAGGRFFYGDEVFRRFMEQAIVALQGHRVRFLLVSNQPIDLDHYVGLDVTVGPGDAVSDLYSLAACDYLMGPPSTFTSWASFFGKVPFYEIRDATSVLHKENFKVCDG